MTPPPPYLIMKFSGPNHFNESIYRYWEMGYKVKSWTVNIWGTIHVLFEYRNNSE